jgi:hypothetical protein
MSERRINLDTPVIPDPQRIAWMEANGIDPFSVPAAQEVLVTDHEIKFVQFVRSPDGIKKLSAEGGYEKELVTLPLISAPQNHGL